MENKVSKFDKFEAWLEKWLMPLADKLQSQPHLQALKNGMMALMAIIMVGCFSLLVYAIPNMLGFKISAYAVNIITVPFNLTLGLLSIYAAGTIAYSLSKEYKLDPLCCVLTAIIVQIVLCGNLDNGKLDVNYLDAKGLFVGMIIGLLTVEITRFLMSHNMTFNMPDNVPPIVMKVFQSIIPMFINVIMFYAIGVIIKLSTGVNAAQLIMKALAPAINSLDNPFALVILVLISQLLWFFGIHGMAVTSAIYLPLATQYLASNAAAKMAGQPLAHVFTYGFYLNFVLLTGSGITGGLVFWMLFSKSKHLKSVGKLALIPAIFNINEPVTFGLPIVLNPIMFIPFVIGPAVCSLVAYLPFYWGWLTKPYIDPPMCTPSIIGGFLTNMDWRSIVLVAIICVLSAAMYYPFFKIVEKQEVEKENALKAANDSSK